jgi:hypothetical protein
MWNSIVCRHYEVRWLDAHTCHCGGCGKFGHYFEEGYAIWTKAARRPTDESPSHQVSLEKLAG